MNKRNSKHRKISFFAEITVIGELFSSPFSITQGKIRLLYLFLAFSTLTKANINSTDLAAPKPNVKSCNVCLCMILFLTLYRFVSGFVLCFTLCLLSTFNQQSKKKEVAFLKGFNAAPTNSRTDGGRTHRSIVMTMSSVLRINPFLVLILLR